MKTKSYRILVLSDLKGSSEKLIESTVNFAKRVNGDLDFFHVKKPADIVEKENQINAIRDIKKEYKLADKQLEDLTSSISGDYNVTYSFAFGNVKSEIEKHIENTGPDVIILGKRKLKSLGLLGDKITRFVLKKYTGAILITSEEKKLSFETDIALGVLNSFDDALDIEKRMIGESTKPIKVFKVADNKVQDQDSVRSKSEEPKVEYVFDKQDDTLKKILKFLPKSNVDLFCVRRDDTINGRLIKQNEIEKIINKCTVPLLITG